MLPLMTTTSHSDHPTTIINPTMKLSDRLALAACESIDEIPCSETCSTCRRFASAVAHELADYLDERFGHSETANLIRGVMPEVG